MKKNSLIKSLLVSTLMSSLSVGATALTCQEAGMVDDSALSGEYYALSGANNRYELEGEWGWLDANSSHHRVNFYSSQGSQDHDVFQIHSGNPRASGSLHFYSRGFESVYAEFHDNSTPAYEFDPTLNVYHHCKNVLVQDAPLLWVNFNATQYPISATYGFSLDPYSKAARENLPVTFTLTSTGNGKVINEITIPAGQLTGTFTINNPAVPQGYAGIGEINDGTYSTSVKFVKPNFSGTSPACLTACPSSLGPFQAQCKGTSSACR